MNVLYKIGLYRILKFYIANSIGYSGYNKNFDLPVLTS